MHNLLGSKLKLSSPSSGGVSSFRASVAPNSSVAIITNGNDEILTRPAETQKLIDLSDTSITASSPFEAMKVPTGDSRNVQNDPSLQITSEKSDFFNYSPIVAMDDIESEPKLRLVNENRTWLDVVSLQLETQARESEAKQRQMLNLTRLQRSDSNDSLPDTAGVTSSSSEGVEKNSMARTNSRWVFHMGFPHPGNVISRIHYSVFHIGLPMESMSIVEFAQQLKTTGCVRMVVPREVLAAIADDQNLINSSDARYHWKPLHIRIVEERNRLPIAFNLQITTRIPDTGITAVRSRQQWVSPTGPNPWGGNTLPVLSYVTQPGTIRIGKQEQKSLYVADDIVNSIEFNRWIQVDDMEMKRRLAKYAQGNDYWVQMPDVNQYIATDEIQFVLITEMHRLTQLCSIFKVEQPTLHDPQKERPTIQINKEVLNTVLNQKLQLYNKSQYLMRLEDIEFVLTPVRQNSWIQDLDNVVNRASKVASVHESQIASYSLKVEIAYENYSANAHLRNTAMSTTTTSSSNKQMNNHSTGGILSPPPSTSMGMMMMEPQQQIQQQQNQWTNSFYEGNVLLGRR